MADAKIPIEGNDTTQSLTTPTKDAEPTYTGTQMANHFLTGLDEKEFRSDDATQTIIPEDEYLESSAYHAYREQTCWMISLSVTFSRFLLVSEDFNLGVVLSHGLALYASLEALYKRQTSPVVQYILMVATALGLFYIGELAELLLLHAKYPTTHRVFQTGMHLTLSYTVVSEIRWLLETRFPRDYEPAPLLPPLLSLHSEENMRLWFYQAFLFYFSPISPTIKCLLQGNYTKLIQKLAESIITLAMIRTWAFGVWDTYKSFSKKSPINLSGPDRVSTFDHNATV